MLQAVNSGYWGYEFITFDAGVYEALMYEDDYGGLFSPPQPCIQCNDLLNTLAVI